MGSKACIRVTIEGLNGDKHTLNVDPDLWREDADMVLGKIYEALAGIAGEPVGQATQPEARAHRMGVGYPRSFPNKAPSCLSIRSPSKGAFHTIALAVQGGGLFLH
jgi:hypothetical protein